MISLVVRSDMIATHTNGPAANAVYPASRMISRECRSGFVMTSIFELAALAQRHGQRQDDGQHDDEPDRRDGRRIAEIERRPLEGALVDVGRDGFGRPQRAAFGG